jgi:hypothetical protein
MFLQCSWAGLDLNAEIAAAAGVARAEQIRSQQQRQRGWKLYSFHAPEVECIGKGKASAPYEFGVKASIVSTNARAPGGQFVLHAKTLPGNPSHGEGRVKQSLMYPIWVLPQGRIQVQSPIA